jgi:hypothetical protein
LISCVAGALIVTAASLLTRMRLDYMAAIFWIYPDSAALQVGRRHRAFGLPKRESLLDTAREFLDEFMKVVDGPDAAARN